MDDIFNEITLLLQQSRSQEVIDKAAALIANQGLPAVDRARAYYLMGNAHRQNNDWKGAMSCYCEAMELDPTGPAAEAYRSCQAILGFYDHDLYNP